MEDDRELTDGCKAVCAISYRSLAALEVSPLAGHSAAMHPYNQDHPSSRREVSIPVRVPADEKDLSTEFTKGPPGGDQAI
jgi:hypothetical protein